MAKNRSHSIEDVIERRRRERDIGGERLVDLRMDFELDGNTLLSAGGVWDRRLGDFDGEAKTAVVVRMHEGQRRAVEWFKAWLEVHTERRVTPPPMPEFDGEVTEIDSDPSRVYAALFAGGRRGGKTWIAVAIAVVYAVMYPGAIVWIVSPNDRKHDEIRRYLAGCAADEWLDRQTAFEYEFCNGSRILLKSAHNPDLLKEGKANLVILNEGQMMSPRAFIVARGAIVDQSGIVIVCANPPVEAKDQQWVADFAAEAAAGRRAAVYLDFNPLLNPHIDRAALLALRGELDERTYAIEVLGQFHGPKDAVAYNWQRLYNEIAPPANYIDVTEAFLRDVEGPGITLIVGLDVQRVPHIGGPWYKLFVPKGVPVTADTVCAWIVGETVLAGGDEVDFCAELEAAALKPSETLIVCDASGRYQHSRRRSADSPPPEWKGRGSFDLIRCEGYTRIVPPDRRSKKNPELVDRARAFTSMISSGLGVRRLFADPVLAPKTCAAIRDWRNTNGKPSRTQEVAHLGDGASYPIIRLFPRRLRSGNPRDVDPVVAKVDRVTALEKLAEEEANLALQAARRPPRGR